MTALGEEAGAKNASLSVSQFPSIYDTYLCHEVSNLSPLPESDLIDIYDKRLRILQSSAGYFARQDRFRDVERLQLETARVYMQNEEWVNAVRVLKPLWQTLSWRQGGWWQLVQEVDRALRDCARRVGDRETLIAVEWELLSDCFTAIPGSQYSFSNCLEDLGSLSTRPKVIVQVEKVKSCLAVTYGFATSQRHVGEKLLSQLIVSSRAHKLSAPIVLKHIILTFQGSLRSIRIECDGERIPESSKDGGLLQLYNVTLKPPISSDGPLSLSTTFGQSSQLLNGASNLSFPSGVTKAFSLETIPREPGDIEIVSATIYIEGDGFEFEVESTSSDHLRQDAMWMRSSGGFSKKAVNRNSLATKILPRPPKIRIHIDNLKKPYFTDELVEFIIKITNNEEVEANVVLQGHLLGQSQDLPSLQWTLHDEIRNGSEQGIKDERLMEYQEKPSTISLGLLYPSEVKSATMSFQAGSEPADYVLKFDVLYHLLTDPETLISNAFETEVMFERPFEANFVVSPQFHPSPWPSYFSADDNDGSLDSSFEDATVARGLRQNWSLTAKIASVVTEVINIGDVSLQFLECLNDTRCKISQPTKPSQDQSSSTPDNSKRWRFDLELQKPSLDDGRPAKLNFLLEIKWRRQGTENAQSIAHIAVPELVIPFGEPRVLASAHPPQGQSASICLQYTIENPSTYALTFNLNMETSDEFAFSGPKATSVQLVPLSRHTVRYNIFPLMRGTWITPLFRVVDPFFSKTLKVQATEGFRSDSEGLHVWVDAED